jgi:hypothetical protein
MTKRPWISSMLLAAAVIITASQAWAVSRQETQTLLNRFGKGALIDLVRQLRENRITITVNGRLQQFIGPPAAEFVTIDTLTQDLKSTGKPLDQLQALLVPTLGSHQTKAKDEPRAPGPKPARSAEADRPDLSAQQPKSVGDANGKAQQLEEAALECRLAEFVDFMPEDTGARVKRFEALRDELDDALEALYTTAHQFYGERVNRNDGVVQFTIEGSDPRWTQILGPQWTQLRKQMPEEMPYFMIQVKFDWQDECRMLQRFTACLDNPQHCRGEVVGDSALKMAQVDGTWMIVDAKSQAEWQQATAMGRGFLETLGWARRHIREQHRLSTPYEKMVLKLAEGYFQRIHDLISQQANAA